MTAFLHEWLTDYRARRLEPNGRKPLDFGASGLTGSVNALGRLIAVNRYHDAEGYMTLTDAPLFVDEQRYKPEAVRAYRKKLTTLHGFGLSLGAEVSAAEAYLIEDAVPLIRLTLENGVHAECLTFAPYDSDLHVIQSWRFSQPNHSARFTGAVQIQRCAYTQLTEGGPLPMPGAATLPLDTQNGIYNPALKTSVQFEGAPGSFDADNGVVSFDAEIAPDANRFEYGLRIFQGDPPAHGGASQTVAGPDLADLAQATLNTWRKRWAGWSDGDNALDPLIRRGLVYGLHCCIPTDDDATCIITDHMLLPLSWNRDAYYVARALLTWRPQSAEIVRRHLIWMFKRAERDGQFWGRSYLVNGRIKDRGFQLDQQIFPLIELAEYTLETGDRATFDRLKGYIVPLLDALMRQKAPGDWLFPTDETPGDDPIPLPFHFSSHILFWRALTLLEQVNAPDDFDYRNAAQGIRRAFAEQFARPRDGQTLYAYAVDNANGAHFYHDANDTPLALAPKWGALTPDDPVWRATVDFAFSPQNKGGFYDIALGSVHTPAPWSLGDLQELLIAEILDQKRRRTETVERLRAAAQWDGGLPEAYHAPDASVASRHWFAWPNALLAQIELGNDTL